MSRILFVHSASIFGGCEHMSYQLMKGLSLQGHQVSLCCPNDNHAFIEKLPKMGVSHAYLPLEAPSVRRPVASFKAIFKWVRFLTNQQIDILHVADLYAARMVLLSAFIARKPVLVHMHFAYDDGAIRWCLKRLPSPHSFIYCCLDLKDELEPKIKPIAPNAIHRVIYNGIDALSFDTPRSEAKPPRIGIIGNFHTIKGHDDFIEMASILVQRGHEVAFDIIGDDTPSSNRRPLLEKQVTERRLNGQVVFHGHLKEIRPTLSELAVLVCASHQEAFPLTVLEAMASGLPVAATNVNGIPEAIVENETGYLVSPHSPEQLANAVEKLIVSAELREKMGQRGKQRVQELFSQPKYLADFLKHYEEVLGQA